MQPLAEAAGWLFGWLLRNSAHAAVLAVLVWGLERTVCRGLPPRWRYGLWLVVLARLLLPVAPESHFSLFNLVDLAPERVAGAALQVLGLPVPVTPTVEPPDPLADTPAWFIGALALWFSGALTLAGFVWRDHRRLRRALAATSPILDPELLNLLSQSKSVMSVSRRVALVETRQITSPAVTGWLRPRLLIPEGLLNRLTQDEIRFLFLHELAHVKRADLAFNWLLTFLQILHWFNPVVWVALRRILAVREEVCDELVLRRCFPGASRDYGLTLLRLLEECAPRLRFPAVAGVLDDVRTLRQRILWIRQFGMTNPHPCVPAGLTVALAVIGLTERIPEPFLWNPMAASHMEILEVPPAGTPTTPAGTVVRTASAASSPASPAAELESRRRDTSAIVMNTLATAIQQVADDVLEGDGTPAPTAVAGSAAQAGATVVPGPVGVSAALPAQRAPLSATTPSFSGVTSRISPFANRPYPLPPVSERGTILRPGRHARDPNSFSPPTWQPQRLREETPLPNYRGPK